VVAVRVDQGGPVTGRPTQGLGSAGARVALDGVEGQVHAAGAFEQADALAEEVVNLVPAVAGGLLVDAGRAGCVRGGPTGAMGTDLGQRLLAQVLPQVPAVADLHRSWQGPAHGLLVCAGAVAADDLDAGVLA
jgi:hypothetical protein